MAFQIHLAYSPPPKKLTLEDLMLKQDASASPIAGTSPFPLLSAEGVRAYRRGLFRQTVFDNCAGSPFPGTLTLRDVEKQSRFIRDFWTHPRTMSIVSEAMGVPLEVVMPTEIGHTNIQVEGDTIDEMTSKLAVEPSTDKVELTDEERAYDPLKDSRAIIPWQYVLNQAPTHCRPSWTSVDPTTATTHIRMSVSSCSARRTA